MNSHKSKRNRGVILTHKGWQKFQKAKLEWELREDSDFKYTLGKISEHAVLAPNTVARIFTRQERVDKRSLVQLFTAFGLELNSEDYFNSSPDSLNEDSTKSPHIYWGEAVDVSTFYGRTDELALLEQWIIQEHCRVVALLGIGGIGKTSLAAKLAQQVQKQFEKIIWHSLRDAPTLVNILANLILIFSNNQFLETELPNSVNDRILLLINYLQAHSCLIIFDCFEALFQKGNYAGFYQEGLENYGLFIRWLGETSHKSCLVITSREKPKEVALLEGKELPVRSLQLRGLNEEEGKQIFQLKGLSGLDFQKKEIIELYSGNPLALKIVATAIQDVYYSHISEFLKAKIVLSSEIISLLDKHFERLTDLEYKIIYWLTINCKYVTISQLQEDFVLPVASHDLLEAFQSLLRRNFIDTIESSIINSPTKYFKLQPLFKEYVNKKFINKICQEIINTNFFLLKSHTFVKASCETNIRQKQIQSIIQPIIKNLLNTFKTPKKIEEKLVQVLNKQREEFPLEPGYTSGNVIKLLEQLQTDLRGYNFSNLCIWQVNLQGINLPQVNFQDANLARVIFTKNFSKISAVTFSPNGKLLAASDASGKIHLWQKFIHSEEFLICKEHISWVRAIAFSPDGKILSSGGTDQNVKIWNTSTGECLKILTGHQGRVQAVAFSPKGKLLASAADDCKVILWNATSGRCHKVLQAHTDAVLSIAFSPKGKLLASASSDRTIKIWNFNTGECLKTLQAHRSVVRSIAFSPNGKTLASGSDDQTIKLWNVVTGECYKTCQEHNGSIRSVAFAPDGKILASGSDDQTIKLWNADTGQCLKTLQGHTHSVNSVAFHSDGQILASGGDDQTIRLWNVNTEQILRIFQGYSYGVLSATFCPQTEILASCNDDQTVKLWDANTGQCQNILQGHSNRVQTVAFNPDGTTLATGSYDKLVKLWNVGTCQCNKTLQGHTGWIKSLAFNPQGNILASGSDDRTVRLWDIGTGQILQTLEHSHGVWSVAFNSQGNILASGSDDQTVKLWNINTGECFKILSEHTDWVLSVAFSSQSNILASSSKDQTVKLWDSHSGECLKTFLGHTSWVLSIAFHPQGNILASSSVDKTVKLWDIQSGQCMKTLQSHTHWIRSVAFSPDGQTLVSASEDGTMRLWDVLTGECLKTLSSERPYEEMNITGVTGLTEATLTSLKALGAIEHK
ncbi:NB-ARC domain-containing protein [Scytonema sp. NUACC21]